MSKKELINESVVEHVASLAKLELKPEQVKNFAKELNEVVKSFKTLDELETNKIEPSFHPIKTINRLREDEVRDSMSKSEALKLAPSKEGEYFKAPRIV